MRQSVGAGAVPRPRIDVVIPNHNTSALAEVALLSLVRTTRDVDRATLRVTVADNWSTDEAVERLKRTAKMTTASWPAPRSGTLVATNIRSVESPW